MPVSVQARNIPAVGSLAQERNKIVHERELPFTAFPPAKFERFHKIGEPLAIKDHALENGVDEGHQRLLRQPVCSGEVGDLPSPPVGLEPFVAGANGGLVEPFAFLQRADIFDDLLALVDELGVGLDQPDELLAADLDLRGGLPGIPGDQLHYVVVVDHGRGEQDELEIGLVDIGWDRLAIPAGRTLPLPEASGRLDVAPAKGAEVVFGKDPLDPIPLLIGQVGVLAELRSEPLDLLEPVDELNACFVTHEVVYLIGCGLKVLRPEELAKVFDGLLEIVYDRGSLFSQPDLTGALGLNAGEECDGFIDAFPLLAEVEDVTVRLGRVENAIGAGECLDQAMVPERLVDI